METRSSSLPNSNAAELWIAERMSGIESSGIRKVFELARTLRDPINLSIGQPDFDVPLEVKQAAHQAIESGHNSYTLTQGIPELRERLLQDVRRNFPNVDHQLMITSGTSGALVLALLCAVNPGDEVILLDPYFVMYPHLIRLAGGVPVFLDTYPKFALDPEQIRAAVTARTKVIILNSPANPTGKVFGTEEIRAVAELAARLGVLLISDEIYQIFCYDTPWAPWASPASYNPDVLVINGFSKSHGMTGWRLGYAHGPRRLVEEMIKLQQFTFVCAPSMVQYAGLAACDLDQVGVTQDYRKKRDFLVQALQNQYEIHGGEGAFYLFLPAPGGSGSAFVEEAIQKNLIVVPGSVFSRRDSHFRLSFATDMHTLERGAAILNRLHENSKNTAHGS